MTALISKARMAQAAEIHILCKSCFLTHHGRIDPPTSMDKETVESYQQRILDDNCAVLTEKDKIVGCIFYTQTKAGFYFYKLAVDPNYRRQGLAQKLLCHIENEALKVGVKRISLNVRIQLLENITLFTKQGYNEVGRHAHPGFDKPTYIEMVKHL